MDLDPKLILAAVQREQGLRGSLHDFVRMAWPIVEPSAPFQDTWHIPAVCEHLEAVSRRQIRKLVINQPPGTGKSLLCNVFWPVWQWIRNADHRWIFASFDITLCLRDARKCLTILQSEWFQERWGDRVILKDANQSAAGDFENLAGGFRFCTSIPKGRVTGRHGDTHVYDDPIKPAEVNRLSLDKARLWFRETAPSRFRDMQTGAKVLIMQRLHASDPAGEFLAEGDWEHLRLPMRFEAKECSYTSVGGDMRTEEGELLDLKRFPDDEVKQLERDMGSRVSAAQLQQRPVPEGGGVFKGTWRRTWIQPGDPVPLDVPHIVIPAVFEQAYWSWDCAFKGTEDSDFVAGQLWARSGANYFCLAQLRDHWSFPETLAKVLEGKRMKPVPGLHVGGILIEDKANGPAVISTLEKQVSGLIAVNPEGGKEARANAVSPLYEAGNVYYPDPERPGNEWVDHHWIELTTFPLGRNDDTVDCATQALIKLHQNYKSFSEAMKKVEKMRTNPFAAN